ncbi:MAG: WYL domain-containing protein [Ruminococcaceae bacterium]|nr:WYL domain-containing protein [Oscillospiraceae bacterium]
MPKKPRQKLKLLYILKLLTEKTDENNRVTVQQIISYLDSNGISAERKSIYDDIESLRVFGYEICSVKSRTVEYFLGDREFQLPELKLLVDAVQSSKFITLKKSNELIKKLENLASRNDAKKLQRQVVVSNRVKTLNEKIYYSVDSLHEAISSGNQISFYYYKWAITESSAQKVEKIRRNNGEKYIVSPWALSWDDENYYLIAYDSNAKMIKHFRVDKMENVEVLQKTKRDGKDVFNKFDMAVYSKQIFGMFGGELTDVKLRFDNSLVGVVVDRFSKNVPISKNSDGTFDISTKVMLSPNFYGWIFALKDKAKIIEPKRAKDEFLTYIEDIKSLYK